MVGFVNDILTIFKLRQCRCWHLGHVMAALLSKGRARPIMNLGLDHAASTRAVWIARPAVDSD